MSETYLGRDKWSDEAGESVETLGEVETEGSLVRRSENGNVLYIEVRFR